MADQKKCKLTSSDGEEFEVTQELAKQCNLVKEMLADNSEELPNIPVAKVRGDVLKKVIEFCEHHAKEPLDEFQTPLQTDRLRELVSDWYCDFIEPLEVEDVYDFILAANYLDHKQLLELSCAKIATMIKNKSPEDMRRILKVPADEPSAEAAPTKVEAQ